jgi:hypothetical protein
VVGKPSNWERLTTAIHEVLVREWNPIGFSVPDDEYDSYIPVILRMVMGGADMAEIGSHLERIQTADMGLPGNRERNNRIAQVLIERTRESANSGQRRGQASSGESGG